ncbi:MAG: UDP binding domain-containing protein, partial [bacterium]
LNEWQQHRIARLVVQHLFGTVCGKRLAVLGFAFKADTNDTRESPAIRICSDLLEEGAQLAIFDPKVSTDQIRRDLNLDPVICPDASALSGEGVWQSVSSPEAAVSGADAVLILTEWKVFASLDWSQLARVMRQPSWLFDARAIVNHDAARAAGLSVWSVGKG